MGKQHDGEEQMGSGFLPPFFGEPPPPPFRRTEADTLATVAIHLWRTEGWLPRILSPAPFSGKDVTASRLSAAGVPIGQVRWSHQGIDYEAERDDLFWRIEAKGLGESTNGATHRNNMDRVVASAVAAYDPPQGGRLRLGIAIADCREYRPTLSTPLPCALRISLDLWVRVGYAGGNVPAYPPKTDLPFMRIRRSRWAF